mmetsp:Transcript_16221/g.27445  ORF Transcript_16221/g.27445 Transcript_16221/m.27445 type:complete len:82 (-) Transcript_16221:22-267(-)
MFDTGSSLAYVVSDQCDNNLCPQAVKFAQSSVSVTFKENSDGKSDLMAHCYGQGCVSGNVSKDNFCFTEDSSSCINGTIFL